MSASISQRILSLWLRHLSTNRIARLRKDRGTRGLAIVGKRGNVEMLVATDEAAENLGLSPGLTLAQARAMYPNLNTIAEDTPADRQWLESLADWCLRYTPLVAIDPPDGLLLDISGCAHLFGGEAALVRHLSERLKKVDLAHSIAIAGTIGAAWAAAHYGKPDATRPNYACGEERMLLMPLPIAALRLEKSTIDSLARLGLKHIGDIIDLPRAPLTARFGPQLLRQLDYALGREHEPLNPRLPVAPYVAEQNFAEPILREEDVLGSIERLAKRLKFLLENRGEGARQFELTLFRTDGAVRRLIVSTSHPLREPCDIRALFVERLRALGDTLDPGFGFDMARLSVIVAEPFHAEQIDIGSAEDKTEIDRLVDRLSARLGRARVCRLIAQSSHIPECAVAPVSVQIKSVTSHWDEFRHYRAETELAPRPLRLLTKPEPIEAMAEVPDGPPLRFRWRRAMHDVVAAEGPERIEGAWWSEQSEPARDYFCVEDKTGLRFWLFRLGLYRDSAKGAVRPTWFVHGTFG